MTTISSSGNFIGLAGICLDRLLKQRSALRKPDFSFDFPPPRGGLRSLSVGADCIATESRALSERLCQARQTSPDISHSLHPSKATFCANADSGLRTQRISGLSTKPPGGFVFSPHFPTTIANQNALSEANAQGKHAEREKCGLVRPSRNQMKNERI